MKSHRTDFNRNVHCLLGLPFDAVDLAQAVAHVRDASVNHQRCFFSTPNLNFLIACHQDADFRDSVIHSDLSVADGMPLIWIARLLNTPLTERVAGSSLFEKLRWDAKSKIKVFFFGGPSGSAESACINLNAKPVGMHCVGFDSPGFGSIEEMSSVEVIDRINQSEADFLVVALGAKKGNAWIEHNLPRLAVPVVSHLGAVVNFVAGSVSRAPLWMQRMGLEWVWRIREEPQLWTRYFKDGVAFIRLLLTCVFPYAWHMRRQSALLPTLNTAELRLEESATQQVIALRGAFIQANLTSLKVAFAQVAQSEVDVCMDLAEVNHVDSAFIGLLLLLYGHQQLIGKRFLILSTQLPVVKIFRWNCAGFLLSSLNE